MESVVDASVLMAVLLNEPAKPALVALTANVDLVAPRCLPWEIGNALSAMLRRGRLTGDVAKSSFASFETVPLRYVGVDVGNALQLCADHGLYAYDAYYLECARRLCVPLLTLDRRLRQVATASGVAVPEF